MRRYALVHNLLDGGVLFSAHRKGEGMDDENDSNDPDDGDILSLTTGGACDQ